MPGKLPSFGPLVLSLLVFPTLACNRTDLAFTATGPAPVQANVSISSSFGVEPTVLRPEILPGSCGSHFPFGVRVGITVRGGEDVIIRALRFSFEDRSGTRALPEVMPIPSLLAPLPAGPTLPASSPVTLPGIAPLPAGTSIPTPGGQPASGLLIPAGTLRRFDFFLHFTCVVVSQGDVVVIIEAADREGRTETSEHRLRVVF